MVHANLTYLFIVVGKAASSPSEFRRYRTNYSIEQIAILEDEFSKANYMSLTKKKQLSTELGLPEDTIKVWFQNRRMKQKREKQMSMASEAAAFNSYMMLQQPGFIQVPGLIPTKTQMSGLIAPQLAMNPMDYYSRIMFPPSPTLPVSPTLPFVHQGPNVCTSPLSSPYGMFQSAPTSMTPSPNSMLHSPNSTISSPGATALTPSPVPSPCSVLPELHPLHTSTQLTSVTDCKQTNTQANHVHNLFRPYLD